MPIKSDTVAFGSGLLRYESYKSVGCFFLISIYMYACNFSFLSTYYCFLLQKPIGVIALLDEAWYCLSSLILIGVHLLISIANLA